MAVSFHRHHFKHAETHTHTLFVYLYLESKFDVKRQLFTVISAQIGINLRVRAHTNITHVFIHLAIRFYFSSQLIVT